MARISVEAAAAFYRGDRTRNQRGRIIYAASLQGARHRVDTFLANGKPVPWETSQGEITVQMRPLKWAYSVCAEAYADRLTDAMTFLTDLCAVKAALEASGANVAISKVGNNGACTIAGYAEIGGRSLPVRVGMDGHRVTLEITSRRASDLLKLLDKKDAGEK
jgi:hypothetical protein